VLEALQRLAPAVLRHLIAYGELLCEETGDALRLSRRRTLGLAVAVAAGVMALALACLLAIAASWNGPNRLAVIGALCGAFVVVALVGIAYARAARANGRAAPFERLRAEWRADMRELAALDPSFAVLAPTSMSAGPAHGE
jgi:energy-converting hydrogenase Eha subunit G